MLDMKVGIKLIAFLLYLILATNAAPKGNGNAGDGENEGAEAGEAGEEGEGGEAGEQGEVGEGGEQGEIGEEEGPTKGSEVDVRPPNAMVKSQPTTAATSANEKLVAKSSATEVATNNQRTGVSGSVASEVARGTPEMSTMPLVTLDDFNFLDKNGDGILDYVELFLGKNNYNPIYLNAAFRISDKNFDGVVDQREFFRHPLSWGRVVAEKQFFAKDISTLGESASVSVTSEPSVPPTVEQTYTASPEGTSPQLPEDNVTSSVAPAEQNITDLTAGDQQTSVSTDLSTAAYVSVVSNANGGQSASPTKGTSIQIKPEPKVPQRQKEGANGKTGSQVGSKAVTATESKMGQPTQGKVVDRPVGNGVVSNGGLTAASKGGAVADRRGGYQAGMATRQDDLKKTVAGSSGGQQRGMLGSFGGQKHGQKAGVAVSVGSHAEPVAGKMRGQAMSHGYQHRTTAGSHSPGVQSGVSASTGGKSRGHTVAYGHPQSAQASWPRKAQEQSKPQFHRWDGQKWVNVDADLGVPREMGGSYHIKSRGIEYNKGITKSAGMEKKYSPAQKKDMANAQSEEEEDEESSNEEEEDKNGKTKNGNGNGDKESEDTEDKDKTDKE